MSFLQQNPEYALLIEHMNARGAYIGQMYFIPLIDLDGLSSSSCGILGEMIESLESRNIAYLNGQLEGLLGRIAKVNLDEADELIDLLTFIRLNSTKPYLAQVLIVDAIHGVDVRDGVITDWRGVNSIRRDFWVLADDMLDLIQQATALAEKNLLDFLHSQTEST